MQKLKAVVLYGGRSTEHEISCRSAATIFRHIDRQKHDVYAIGIDRHGVWHPQDRPRFEREQYEVLPIHTQSPTDDMSRRIAERLQSCSGTKDDLVVFSILHGTYGEDGCMQGFFDLQGLAYVGPGTLGSAVAMDKVVAKQLVAAAGIPVVPYVELRSYQWEGDREAWLRRIREELVFPLFVKPANLGSSVGIRQVLHSEELAAAIDSAFRFDERVLIENGLSVREIEYACLGAYEPELTVPGEIGVAQGFYSYDEKYASTSHADILVPAPLSADRLEEGRQLAKRAFQALNLYGMARIDLFLTRDTGKFYFNEANTLPGFTSISQYPKLWAHSGLSLRDLLNRLLDLACQRRDARARLQRELA